MPAIEESEVIRDRATAVTGFANILDETVNPEEIVDRHPVAYLKRFEMDDLDDGELFGADLLVPGGPNRSCVYRSSGVNYWSETGYEETYPSSEFRRLLEAYFENPFVYQICVGDVFEGVKMKSYSE